MLPFLPFQYGNEAAHVVTGGGSWTPASLGAGLALWIEPAKGSMNQAIDNSGSAASANGNPIGYIPDFSGNGFHLSAVANDTTRPLLQGVVSYPYIDFDGGNDFLGRSSSLGLYNSGAQFSIWAAVRGNPTTNAILVSESNTSTTTPLISCLSSSAGPASTEVEFYRNDATTMSTSALAASSTGFWDNSDHVIGFTDTTTQFQTYKDGTANGLVSYTSGRYGTTTINQFSLGALRRTSVGSWFASRVYCLVIYKGTLSGSDISNLNTYLGARCGLTL